MINNSYIHIIIIVYIKRQYYIFRYALKPINDDYLEQENIKSYL